MSPFLDTNQGQTHYHGCWRDLAHHACAVALLEGAADIMLDGTNEWFVFEEWLRDAGFIKEEE